MSLSQKPRFRRVLDMVPPNGSFPGDWVAGCARSLPTPSIAPAAIFRIALDSSRQSSPIANAFQLVPAKFFPESVFVETTTIAAQISSKSPPNVISEKPQVPQYDRLRRPNAIYEIPPVHQCLHTYNKRRRPDFTSERPPLVTPYDQHRRPSSKPRLPLVSTKISPAHRSVAVSFKVSSAQ